MNAGGGGRGARGGVWDAAAPSKPADTPNAGDRSALSEVRARCKDPGRRSVTGSATVVSMPIRQGIWAGLLVSWAALATTACSDEKEVAAKIAEVQRVADEKLKKVEQTANDKVAAMQKQLDQMKSDAEAQATKLKSEADEAIAKAQGDAEAQAKAAEDALKKARAAYKAEGLQQLAQLNKQVQEVSGKMAKASPKVKPLVQKQMKDIVKEQQQIAKDLAAFDKAALDGLGAAKVKLVQDLAKMKQTIASMKAKLA